MEQPGVEIRPIKMMTGLSEFNETFFTDARTAKDNVVSGVNNGWAVAMTLLGYERGEAAATFPIMFKAEIDRLMGLARATGAADDPLIRQRLAWCYSKVEIMRYLGMRTLTKFLAGGQPGPAESTFKLFWSEYHKIVTDLGVDILGSRALTPSGRMSTGFQADDVGAPNDSASWVTAFLMSRAGSIYAGSSQIQRNIIGEMVLGLPKEPAAATQGKSWRELQGASG
jgi:alkylation response protein AidB-like acyl-CoA dehydrogenase